MMVTPVELIAGVTADVLFGDPRWLPHPVVGIGRIASWMERVWRSTRLPLRMAGAGAWLGVMSATCAVVYATLRWLPAPYVQIYWIYSLLAVRSLDDHAMAVVRCLRARRLDAAREAVGRMVGRDTQHLNESEVMRATIETVAENMSDGIVAPLFWLLLGGPAGMAAYKAVNTMDSMFGYRNERYREFGWCAARMDDVANWIPARLTAVLIWMMAALLPRLRFFDSVRVTWRDASLQPSPNSGYPEAAVAGALGVRLGGVNYYRGVRSEKAYLGDDTRKLDSSAYRPLRAVLYGATMLAVGGMLAWL